MSEVIDMNNDNALVALAYIKTCENPLTVFCNYIMYVLSTTSDYKLRVDELRIKVFEKFGLAMPHQIMSVCVRILKKNKKLSMLPNGAGYQLEGRPFNIQELDGTLLRLHKQEDLVVERLIAFIQDHYKQSWTKEEAKRYLSNFLDKQGRAAEIFLDGEIREMSGNALSHDLYIGRFVENLSEDKNSTEWSYLVELIYGMMIYQGVYQTHDYERDKGKKFKGTRFFLDTKLVLRAMGFSSSIHVQATEEFIKLVTEEYAGKICVFD